MENKPILQRIAENIEKDSKPLPDSPSGPDASIKSDEDYIQEAILASEKLKGATGSHGSAFVTQDFIRGYSLEVPIATKPMPEKVVAFVFQELNKQVLEFLVVNSLNNNIKKLLSLTDHCVLVKDFKALGVQ